MAKFKGFIAGKGITTYTSKENIKYSSEDINQYLKQFRLSDALRFIGETSFKLFEFNIQNYEINGIPVFEGALAYIAMRLIENSNDHSNKIMAENDLLTAIDMYLGMPDPMLVNNDNPEGSLIRLGATQLEYDQELRHTLPRTLIIYRDLWSQVEEAKKVDVKKALEDIYGLDIDEILFFSFAFCSVAKQGFFRVLDKNQIANFNNVLNKRINWQKQQQFIDNISSNYQDFKKELRSEKVPSPQYEGFRFNPLATTPAIIPDINPKPNSSQVYITPIVKLLSKRVTAGLYFELSNHFTKGKRNPFRDAFGYVFQKYVGLLLKKSFESRNIIEANSNIKVHSEWKYGSRGKTKDTPDWLIVKNKSAILIEVKQSGLYLEAKKWGNLSKVTQDLNKTIAAGVNQMWKFEQDIQSNKYPKLKWLSDINITEKIVITYDHSYFLNSILRDQVKNANTHIPTDYHWHTIPIADFEYFIGIARTNIFKLLRDKRQNRDVDIMDFRDYYARICTQEQIDNPYLSQVYEDYFNQLGLKG
jgi:hypothetical protein